MSGVHMLATIDVQRLNAEEKGGNVRLGNKYILGQIFQQVT